MAKSLDDVQAALKVYQELQLITKSYNNIHHPVIIPLFILMSIMTICVPIFVLMAYFDEIGLFIRVLFSLGPPFGVLSILCCLRYPILIVSRSDKALGKTKLRLIEITTIQSNKKSRNIVKRSLKSLKTIRIAYIQNSYFRNNTPFMLLNLSIRLAIRLILVKREQ